MGSRFLTEKKIEDFLTEEVRALPFPDGTIKNVRGFKLTWANYDIVLEHGNLSAAELSALAAFYAGKTGCDLDHAMREILPPLRKAANRVLEKKIALRKRRITMRNDLLGGFADAARGAVKPREGKPRDAIRPVVFRNLIGPQFRQE